MEKLYPQWVTLTDHPGSIYFEKNRHIPTKANLLVQKWDHPISLLPHAMIHVFSRKYGVTWEYIFDTNSRS